MHNESVKIVCKKTKSPIRPSGLSEFCKIRNLQRRKETEANGGLTKTYRGYMKPLKVHSIPLPSPRRPPPDGLLPRLKLLDTSNESLNLT